MVVGWGGCKVIFVSNPTTVEVISRLVRTPVANRVNVDNNNVSDD